MFDEFLKAKLWAVAKSSQITLELYTSCFTKFHIKFAGLIEQISELYHVFLDIKSQEDGKYVGHNFSTHSAVAKAAKQIKVLEVL